MGTVSGTCSRASVQTLVRQPCRPPICWSCCRRNLSAAYSHYQQAAALRQGVLHGQLPGGDAWRCGADGRAADDDSLLHRRPSGYPLSRLARLEMGARRSPCSTIHRLRRRVCAPQGHREMLPASNFVCEFGECVRPASPMLGGVVMLACLLVPSVRCVSVFA